MFKKLLNCRHKLVAFFHSYLLYCHDWAAHIASGSGDRLADGGSCQSKARRLLAQTVLFESPGVEPGPGNHITITITVTAHSHNKNNNNNSRRGKLVVNNNILLLLHYLLSD